MESFAPAFLKGISEISVLMLKKGSETGENPVPRLSVVFKKMFQKINKKSFSGHSKFGLNSCWFQIVIGVGAGNDDRLGGGVRHPLRKVGGPDHPLPPEPGSKRQLKGNL